MVPFCSVQSPESLKSFSIRCVQAPAAGSMTTIPSPLVPAKINPIILKEYFSALIHLIRAVFADVAKRGSAVRSIDVLHRDGYRLASLD